jgi:superfamily II DNA or RNA helicase
MLVRLTEAQCILISAEAEEQKWLKAVLLVEDVAESQRRKFRGLFSGKTPTIDLSWKDTAGRLCFPVGLVPTISRMAERDSIEFNVVDVRTIPDTTGVREAIIAAQTDDALKLRYYQADALLAILDGTSKSAVVNKPIKGRGIIKIATGGGKSQIAAALPILFPGRWLFLVHRSHLAIDVAGRYEKFTGEHAGRILEGKFEPGDKFTVATIQSLHTKLGENRFKDWASKIDGVIIDECHTVAAETHGAVAQSFTKAYWKVGLSGTPLDRADKKSIQAVGAIGPIIYEKTPGELIAEGFLARPTVKIVPCWQPPFRGDWQSLYNNRIKNSKHRNGAIVAAMVAHSSPVIVFVKQIDHGKEIARLARAKGLDVDFVNGDWSLERRQAVIKKLDLGVIQWVIASSVFNEGVDIPCLETVVIATGGKAIIPTLQMVGRGTRKTASKDTFTVVDIGDRGNEVLNEHSKERIKACQREGYRCVMETNLWPEKAVDNPA